MKNLIILLICITLLSITSNLYSTDSTIIIDTNYGKKEIIVPDDYNELKEAYLTTTKNYIEAENELKQVITNNQTLNFRITELITQLEKTDKKNNELILLLENRPISTKTLFNPYAKFGIEYFPLRETNIVNGNIGIGLTIWEKFMMDISVGFPDVSLMFNIGIYIR